MNEPITRSEMYLAALGGEAVTPPEPITRMDMYMAYLNGMTDTYPEPITRTEQYLYKLCQNGMGGGGGGGVTIRNQNKTITENGTYRHDTGYTGLGTVTVNVPQEDPVLQDKTVTENGTVTADAGFDGLGVVTVNVAASGGSGDEDNVKAMLENNLEVLIHNTATKIAVSRIFQGNKVLRKVDLPNLTEITGSYVFTECSALEELNLPKLKSMASFCFLNCTGLTEVSLPELNAFYHNGNFSGCKNLRKIYFGRKEAEGVGLAFGQNTFNGCSSLNVVILRLETKAVGLANVNAFTDTPFASGGTGGTVYCPAALITQYQQATNWATLYAAGTCNFVAIEGSEYE